MFNHSIVKILICSILVCICFSINQPESLQAAPTRADPANPEQALKQANDDMQLYYKKDNYFPASTSKGAYRKDLIQRSINNHGGGSKWLNYAIVYGAENGGTFDGIREFSGYSVGGDPVAAEGIKWYAGWSGIEIQDFDLEEHPWKNVNIQDSFNVSKTDFDWYKSSSNIEFAKYTEDGTLEQAIINGLNERYADEPYATFMYQNKNSSLSTKKVYTRDAHPSRGTHRWVDYVHVIQPPTFYSWGYGKIFINHSDGHITYMDVPIAPFGIDRHDLSATFEELPSSAEEGEDVQVRILIKSTFPEAVKSDFAWDITEKASGRKLTIAQDQLNYDGHAKVGNGKLDIPANGERSLRATFTMPAGDVQIRFKVNEKGDSPAEDNLTNNVLDSDPAAIRLARPTPLGYSVLSRKIKQPLFAGNPITASLSLPQGSWDSGSNATGKLDLNNLTPLLLQNFTELNNPAVNEPSETISRQPSFSAVVSRTSAGDDPVNHQWLNWPTPDVAKSMNGKVGFSGSVSRNYSYTYWGNCHLVDGEKEGDPQQEHCDLLTGHGTATANFPSSTDTFPYDFKIYNGKSALTSPTFQEKIENNSRTSTQKLLSWISDPYRFDVKRWMYHLDENDKIYGRTTVDGQYPRTFTEQATGDLEWSTDGSQAKAYEPALAAAKNKTNVKSAYDRAVFATDRDLQRKFAYPIKSGYYFNPAGTYSFTIETVNYKPTTADTAEHQALVDAMIDSFHYESDLMYVNNKRIPVNISNEPLSKQGNTYQRKTGTLTATNPKGVNGETLLTVIDRSKDSSRFTKKVQELGHSESPSGSTNASWKAVMEGYTESGTADSNAKYEYREYVFDGSHLYKITERTEVTIVINQDNKISTYTYANMPNGTYPIKVWMDDIDLRKGSFGYKGLGTLKGITLMDSLNVNVYGSMYDDLNN